MKRNSLLAVAAFCAALALPGLAAAQSLAFAAGGGYTNMRAGPGTGYPVIARLVPGTQVQVLGCLATRDWCEALVQNLRGWVHGSRLEFVYAGRRVLVPQYWSYFRAPTVVFRFGGFESNYHRRDNYNKGPIYRNDRRDDPDVGNNAPRRSSYDENARRRSGNDNDNDGRRRARNDNDGPRKAEEDGNKGNKGKRDGRRCGPGQPNCIQ